MSKLNTTNIKTGGGTPKLLQPGNAVCKITGVSLRPFTFKPGGLEILLHLEGPDLGKDFEGFFIDKNNESLGRHKGQVGQVKASEWAFADGETKSKIPVSRDMEMLKFMKSLCSALEIDAWLDLQNDKHDTIESLIKAFNDQKPYGTKTLEYCICGKEYVGKSGYTNFDLFLPKFSKTGVPFGKSRVIKFNPDEHIRKKKSEPVSEFGEDNNGLAGPAADDFKL